MTAQYALPPEPWIGGQQFDLRVQPSSVRRSAFGFFLRYPIFLLAFGPPEFKPPVLGVDTSQAHFDAWNVLQVGWLSIVALRAAVRLTRNRSILIPRHIRSVLKLEFILGLLFLGSVAYSPGRVITAEYCFLYALNWICVVEFVADAHRDPPDWMQCLFQLRLVAVILVATVLFTLLFVPVLVVYGQGRLMGGAVASMPFDCPIVALISAYAFLHSLESRTKSAVLFTIGAAGTLATQTRGVEISLAVLLLMVGLNWAKTNKRLACVAISAVMASILFGGVVLGTIGAGPLWLFFNRGQSAETIATASGRTGVWRDQLVYCLIHPQGMGYIAGVRAFHRRDYASNLHAALTNIGGTDNSYMEVLTDAGWLALGTYLTLLAKTISLSWRWAKPRRNLRAARGADDRFFACCLFLLFFCLAEGMESSTYVIPMSGPFYAQNLLIALLLAASAHATTLARGTVPAKTSA
jgi:hypothetical protein